MIALFHSQGGFSFTATLLNQCAYNLKKVLQLYRDDALSEDMLMALRL